MEGFRIYIYRMVFKYQRFPLYCSHTWHMLVCPAVLVDGCHRCCNLSRCGTAPFLESVHAQNV